MFSLRSAIFCATTIFVFGISYINGRECIHKEFQRGLSCMCNSTHCDEIEVQEPPLNGYHIYTSSASGLRFRLATADAGNCSEEPDRTITINPSDVRQEIYGFGGALTDSAGIQYNFIRIPIAGSDYSTRPYFYTTNDTVDMSLSTFKLAEEDLKIRIPLLQYIKKISTREIKLMGSPWHAPSWMVKSTCQGTPAISEEYYQTWANYFKLFLDEYEKHGLTFDSVTTANEPQLGFVSQSWCLDNMNKFIANALGPVLESSHPDVKILNLDDQTPFLFPWMTSLDIPEVNKYVSGMATHFYMDNPRIIPLGHQIFHHKYPNKSIISTEASICQFEPDFFTSTSWDKAVRYMDDQIPKLLNFLNGWIDWNMVLDLQGGPNHISNFCDAPIIVNCTADEFYKQPAFYAMGHLSKFIPPGSHAIGSTQEYSPDIESVAFITPKSQVVIHVQNRSKNSKTVNIKNQGKCSTVTLPPQSISSIVSSV